MDKKQLRKSIKAQVALMSAESKLEQSNNVFQYIENSPLFAQSKRVMIFSSLPDEIPTHHVIERWSKIKELYLPRVNGDDLEVVRYSPSEITTGSFNILEPTSKDLLSPLMLDLIIVPGVAFDRNGNRCGRGKGFYDRFLSQTHAATIAVCFDCQLVEQLPTEPHDIPAQYIVTNSFKTL
ncbi:MAG: 5-formyltetrahydrofolate cyclo-ligase [Muribaculaceae bacterium]|nr:5-formyltetrahydrofolate cyclo-ligase [Muribaculaceae bacterium]MBQ2562638.1 5-formyltetrahydrofolate cyclo-ligase [Muribaculaceae bacterium]